MNSRLEAVQPPQRTFPSTHRKALIGVLAFLGMPFGLQALPLGFALGEVGMWLIFFLMMSWIYLVEKRTLASIGWNGWTARTVLVGVGLGCVLFVLFGVINVAIQAIGLELSRDTAMMIASQPWPVLLLVALRAAVVEEALYRGFAFERIFELTNSKFLAGFAPLVLFTLVHLAWGVGHLAFVFLAGGLFTILYARKRNLALLIVAHFTVDVFALMALPLMLGA